MITKHCGGSSSGSAVGISAGFVPLSLGTETGGSLVYPASKSGLYAMRPAHGSVSSNGVFRISRSFDAIGSMARTPYDLSLIAESILTPEARSKLPKNGYKDSLTGSWEGLKVGILPSTWGGQGLEHMAKWGASPVVCSNPLNAKSMLTKNQKEVYDGIEDRIKQNGGIVVFPMEIPEAFHGNDVLAHNGITLKDIACNLYF